MRDILRLGAYELAFSDGVPAHAAVDQAVRQARGLRGPQGPRLRPRRRGQRRDAAPRGRLRGTARRAGGGRGGHGRPAPLDAGLDRRAADRGRSARRTPSAVMRAAGRAGRVGRALEPAAAARGPGSRPSCREGWTRDPAIPEAYVVPRGLRARGLRRLGPGPGHRPEPRLAARGPRRRPRARRADPRPLRRAGGQDDPPRRPGPRGARITAVELHPARARGLRDLARRMGAVVDVVEGDALEVTARRASTRCSSTRPAPGSACCRRARTRAGAAARSRSSRSRACRPACWPARWSWCARAGGSSTRPAR